MQVNYQLITAYRWEGWNLERGGGAAREERKQGKDMAHLKGLGKDKNVLMVIIFILTPLG